MKPNVQVLWEEAPPGKALVDEFLMAERNFGIFHVGDVICIRNTNYRILRRSIDIHVYSADQRLFLFLWVEKVTG